MTEIDNASMLFFVVAKGGWKVTQKRTVGTNTRCCVITKKMYNLKKIEELEDMK